MKTLILLFVPIVMPVPHTSSHAYGLAREWDWSDGLWPVAIAIPGTYFLLLVTRCICPYENPRPLFRIIADDFRYLRSLRLW